ncbi:MAG: acyl carrier protein [Bacteroidales bacterium]|nr:acyl carrier protein [Bacteroidales bacterium]
MKKEDVIVKVNEFLTDEFELEADRVVPDANLRDDLEIESLDFVDIAVEIEKEFGFKIKGEDMIGVKTLDDLYNYILSKAS